MEALAKPAVAAWLCLTGLTVAAPPAAAQFSTRADLSVGGRYVWHGVSRAAGLVAQPSLAVGLRTRGVSVEGGAALHYELDRASSGELSETGAGDRHLGERDVWGRASFVLGPTRLHAGVVRYDFRGDAAQGGVGSARNTTEVFASLSATSRYLNPTFEAWWDVERVHGAFLRASFDLPVLGWPFPPYAFVFVQGEMGLNVGQGPNPVRPGELANFAKRGITHVGLGLGTEVRAGRLGGLGAATLTFGARSQLNVDAATKADGPGRTRDFVVWLWTGMTIVLGGEARNAQ
jgi:hypothetical protein